MGTLDTSGTMTMSPNSKNKKTMNSGAFTAASTPSSTGNSTSTSWNQSVSGAKISDSNTVDSKASLNLKEVGETILQAKDQIQEAGAASYKEFRRAFWRAYDEVKLGFQRGWVEIADAAQHSAHRMAESSKKMAK